VRSRGIRVVDRRLVASAHARGLQVHVWTVNDPAEMTALLDIEVDGIITDRPDLLKEILLARGEW
jgi:glycerophosphoryl diester phosphodiesterase